MSAPSQTTVATQDDRPSPASVSVISVAGMFPRRRHQPHVASGIIVRLAVLALTLVVVRSLLSADAAPLPRASMLTLASSQPAIRSDFADPAMLVVGNVYYAYATNAAGKHVQVARSFDLSHFTLLPDALPTLPAWVDGRGAWVWAPDVIQIGRRFVMYYTAREVRSGRQCIGVASSAVPFGPFLDTNVAPFVCQRDLGGDIDASPFRDEDALYLYFKSDGNCCRIHTHLWGQRLSSDGLHLIGAPVMLLTNDQGWEADVVEAPNMLKTGRSYGLFYSGNDYATNRYAIGYARCQSPLGPCAKPADHPILSTNLAAPIPLVGPGGASFFAAGGVTWVAFHTWGVTVAGAPVAARYMLIERLGWRGGEPVILSPQAATAASIIPPTSR